MKNYQLGTKVDINLTSRDRDGVLWDPDSIRIRVYQVANRGLQEYLYEDSDPSDPSDSVDSDIVRLSEGVYRLTVDTSLISGIWRYNVQTYGDHASCREGSFFVVPSDIEEDSDSSEESSSA